MKIISCYVENFGVISRKSYDFNGGLNCAVRENGAGKTTLASFIKAMLYGLPTVRANSKAFDDRRHFYPFGGGKFGGNLTVAVGGDTYRIERFFDKKSDSRDELTVYKNGKIIACGGDIGRELFGLDEDAFTRTVFITAEDTEAFASGDINKKLNREVRADGDLEGALAALENYKKRLKAARGGGGLIDRKREERQALTDRAASLKELENNLEGLYAERASLEEQTEKLEGARDVQSPEKQELRLNIKLLEIDREYPAGLPTEGEIQRLKSLVIAPAKTQTPEYAANKRVLPLLIISLLIAAAGIVAAFFSLYAGLALIAAGVIGAGVCFLLKNGKKGGKTPPEQDELNSIISRYKLDLSGGIAGAIAKIEQKRKLYNSLLTEIEDLRGGKAFGQRDFRGELNEARRRLSAVDAQIASDEAELETLPACLNKIEALDGEIAALSLKHERVTLALGYLNEADGRLKEKFVAPIHGRFAFYAEKIFTALGERFVMNEDYSISFEQGGELRSQKHLSAGQRAVCGLCIRLSLIDNMFGREKPFVIMDDPFVCLDSENFRGAAKVLKEIARDTQIIYFTCHPSREI